MKIKSRKVKPKEDRTLPVVQDGDEPQPSWPFRAPDPVDIDLSDDEEIDDMGYED